MDLTEPAKLWLLMVLQHCLFLSLLTHIYLFLYYKFLTMYQLHIISYYQLQIRIMYSYRIINKQ